MAKKRRVPKKKSRKDPTKIGEKTAHKNHKRNRGVDNRGVDRPRRHVTSRAMKAADAALRFVLELHQHPEHSDKAPGDVLDAVMRSVDDPFPALARMMVRSNDEYLVQSATRLLAIAAEGNGVPPVARDLARATAVEPLNALLRDARVEDSRKYAIGPLLTLLGAEVPRDEFIACFDEYREPSDEDESSALERLTDDLEGLSRFAVLARLDERARAPDPEGDPLESAYAAVAELCEAGRDIGAWAAVLTVAHALEHDLRDERAVEALDLAASLGSPAAAWVLETLGATPAGGEEAEHALELAEAMIDLGVSPRPLDPGRFTRALVSRADGGGNRTLFVFIERPETEEEAAAVFVLNKNIGIKDAFWILTDVDDAQEDIAAAKPSIAYERCDQQRASELLAEARALHERCGAPPPGRAVVCMEFLTEA
jgi:hypothetical protein